MESSGARSVELGRRIAPWTVAALCLAVPLVVTATPAAAAVVGGISFRAPVHSTYDHSTGGGAWNTGATNWVKGELLGTDFACGDVATFLFQLVTTSSASPASVETVLEFTADSTGQSGVALAPLLDADHLRVNSGSIPGRRGGTTGTGPGGSDAGFAGAFSGLTTPARIATSPAPAVASIGAYFTSGAKRRLTFTTENLPPNSTTIVRSDARILCKAGSTPTGNLQVSLLTARVTSPVVESVSSGNQTVNFRGVANLEGIDEPLLEIVKEVYDASSTAACPGEPTGQARLTVAEAPADVLYCYWVSNWGTATARNLQLVDDRAQLGTPQEIDLAIPGGGTDLRGGGAVATGSLRQTITTAGEFTNIVTASATNVGGPLSAEAVVDITSGPVIAAMTIDKTQTSTGAPDALGDRVGYEIVVRNTGTVTLSDVSVADPSATLTSCTPSLPVTELAPRDTITCAAVHVVTQGDLDAGRVVNVATAVASPPAGPTVIATSDGVTTDTVASPELRVVKRAVDDGPFEVGSTIQYRIVARNTGNVTLTDVRVRDDAADSIDCREDPAALAPGEEVVCTAEREVTADDADSGSVRNVAVARASAPDGDQIRDRSNEEESTVVDACAAADTACEDGPIEVDIDQTSPDPTEPGDPVIFDIDVVNEDDEPLSDVEVDGDNIEVDSCSEELPATLDPGESLECSVTYIATDTDIADDELNVEIEVTARTADGDVVSGASPDLAIADPTDDTGDDTTDGAGADTADGDASLPATGSSLASTLVPWALAAVAIGSGLVATGRRRRRI